MGESDAACGGGLESRFGDALRLQLVVLHYESERERAKFMNGPHLWLHSPLTLNHGERRGDVWVSSVLPDGKI